jgi:hypothetical protein|tara:strand:- start:1975 stop:2802 length:828 start_codon:yes stop_codon:yes gene_type:complete
MATVIQFKRSATQNSVPATSDLTLGELAVNTYHGRFYTEKNDGSASVVEVGSNPATLTVNDAFSFPTADGSSNQVLKTNGSGTLDWSDQPSSGIVVYTYTISSTTTSITGNDDSSNSLSYTSGSEQVYINGVKLVGGGADYTATNSTTLTLAENALSGDVVQVVAITAASNLVQGFFTQGTFTATTADQVLSSNAVANKAVKYVINATHASAGTHAAEVLLINDGTNSYFVQYGDVYSSSSLFTLSSDVDSGNMRLLMTPANTNTTVDTFQIRHS